MAGAFYKGNRRTVANVRQTAATSLLDVVRAGGLLPTCRSSRRVLSTKMPPRTVPDAFTTPGVVSRAMNARGVARPTRTDGLIVPRNLQVACCSRRAAVSHRADPDFPLTGK